jgi:hypothetical protein
MIVFNPVDNFKGKVHQLTKEDCIKGGKSRSDKKVAVAKYNAIKSGNYTKGVKYCSTCLFKVSCPKFVKGPGQKCSIVSPKSLKRVMELKGFNSTRDYDKYILEMSIAFDNIENIQNKRQMDYTFGKIIEFMELKRKLRP